MAEVPCREISNSVIVNASDEINCSSFGSSSDGNEVLHHKPSNKIIENTHNTIVRTFSDYTVQPESKHKIDKEWPEHKENHMNRTNMSDMEARVIIRSATNLDPTQRAKVRSIDIGSSVAVKSYSDKNYMDSQVCINGFNTCFLKIKSCPNSISSNKIQQHSRVRVDFKSRFDRRRSSKTTRKENINQKIMLEWQKLRDENLVGKDAKCEASISESWSDLKQQVCSLNLDPLSNQRVKEQYSDQTFEADIKHHFAIISKKLEENRRKVMNQFRERLDEIDEHNEVWCRDTSSKLSHAGKKDAVFKWLDDFKQQVNQMKEESKGFEDSDGLMIPLIFSEKAKNTYSEGKL